MALTPDIGAGTTRGFVTLAASGQVVAAVAGKRIRVFALVTSALLACNVKFQSNTTDITAAFPLAANGGFVMPAIGQAWFVTATGEALNLVMSLATSVAVQVIYDVVE
jgi:hypothetical protein